MRVTYQQLLGSELVRYVDGWCCSHEKCQRQVFLFGGLQSVDVVGGVAMPPPIPLLPLLLKMNLQS